MATELTLIPRGTRVESNGAGQSFDISRSQTRTFLCTLEVVDQIEQESIDVSVWGSADGENWGTKPIIKIPQAFYRGEERMVLDLTLHPATKFIQARWDLNRWGRVAPTPMFVIGLKALEVPAMPRTKLGDAIAAASSEC
jgi:hypothetical protein